MYKNFIVCAALLCTLTQYASDVTSWFEIKPSYFLFSESPMNEIYNHGGFELQGSASVPFCDWLDFYASLGYRQAWGHALNSDESTNLIVLPVDIGVKAIFNFDERFNYFVAIGPRVFYFHQKNDSLYVDSIMSGAGLGLFVNTGFDILLRDHFLFGVFCEYSYENKTISSDRSNVFSNSNVQMGGFVFGLSLGYAL